MVILSLVAFALDVTSLAAQATRLESLAGEHLTDAELAQGAVAVVWASGSPRWRDICERVNPLVSRWGGRARVIAVNFQEDRGSVQGFLAGKELLGWTSAAATCGPNPGAPRPATPPPAMELWHVRRS